MSDLSNKAKQSTIIALASKILGQELAQQIDASVKRNEANVFETDQSLGGNRLTAVTAVSFNQIATPAAPEDGTDLLYFKDNDRLYRMGSDGIETEVGAGGGGSGDVEGPAVAVDFAIARFDGTSGKLIQESPVLINDSGSFFWVTDNVATLGQPGDNRLKRAYIAENIDIGNIVGGAPGFLHAGVGSTLFTIVGSDNGNQAIVCFTNTLANAGFIHEQADGLGKFSIFNSAGGMNKYFEFNAHALDATGGTFVMQKAEGANILWSGEGKVGDLPLAGRPLAINAASYATIGNSVWHQTESESYYAGFLQVGSKKGAQVDDFPVSDAFLGAGGGSSSKPEIGFHTIKEDGTGIWAYFELDDDENSPTFMDVYYGRPLGAGGNSFILKADGNIEFPNNTYVKHSFYSANNLEWEEYQFRRARGNPDAPTAVQLSDNSLGKVTWHGHDGSAFAESAAISVGVDQTFSPGNHGSHMHLWATPLNTANPVILQRLGSDQVVQFWSDVKIKGIGGNNGSTEYFGFSADEMRLRQNNNGQTMNWFNTVSPTTAGNLGAMNFHGNGGSQRARLDFKATENWDVGANGTGFNVYTTINGTTTQQPRFQVNGLGNSIFSGNVVINSPDNAPSIALDIQQNTAAAGANVLINNENTAAASIAFDLQYNGVLAVNFGVINDGGGNHHAFFDYGNGSSAFTAIQEMGTKNVIIGRGTDSENARLQVAGDIAADVAGAGFKIKEGANAKMGVATLVGGTVTVSNTSVGANSRIFLTPQADGTGTNEGNVRVSARVNATSFTITSSDVTDDRVIAWEIKEPA